MTHEETIRANARMAWCAAWNRAIVAGKRPIEALHLANAAEAAAMNGGKA